MSGLRWYLSRRSQLQVWDLGSMKDEGIPSANNFAMQIEEIVWDKDVTYMEAILLWCSDRGLEPEVAASLVRKSAPLKGKIQLEAESANLLPRPSGNTLW